MWSPLWYLLLGWFISSIALHFGERRGIRSTSPTSNLPGFMSWWGIFSYPFKMIGRPVLRVGGWLYELGWRLVKG